MPMKDEEREKVLHVKLCVEARVVLQVETGSIQHFFEVPAVLRSRNLTKEEP